MRRILSVITFFLVLNLSFAQVQNLSAIGYDSHVELKWDKVKNIDYQIYAKIKGSDTFELRGETQENFYLDFLKDKGRNIVIDYKVIPVSNGKKLKESNIITASIKDFSDEELLDMVQRYTFRYFWDYGEPKTGLNHERTKSSKGNIVTIGGSGFGVMAIIVGAERAWITREQAVERLLHATKFLQETDRFHGMWAHWYNADTGKVREFGKKDNGGDIVESAFMAQGLLTAQQYFNRDNSKEKQLRNRIQKLWEEMEWDFYTNEGNKLIWHWSPDYGFEKNHGIRGYNECLIAYILATSSPTHSIPIEAYHESWAGWDNENFANYTEYYNIILPLGNKRWYGGPLFFAHYSYLGLDPRGLSDKYANYWEQNRRHTLIHRAYCIDNPYGYAGYGEDLWGLSASDVVPNGYSAHAPGYMRDTGHIPPTAALSSMPYTPEESLKVLKNLYRNHGQAIFGPYGFYDVINLSYSDNPNEQVRENYIGIDQGPIIVMIENYRSGLLWNYFMRNNDVLNGLKKLEFRRNGKEIVTQENPTIVVLGSSTAEGAGPRSKDKAWVWMFEKALQQLDERFRVVNLARGGYTTYDLLPTGTKIKEDVNRIVDIQRNINQALAYNPDAIIINLPSNDAAQGFSVQDQMQNYELILKMANENNVPLWVTTPQPRNFELNSENVKIQQQLLKATYQKFEDNTIDFWSDLADKNGHVKPEYDSGDGVHMNDAAHQVLVKRVLEKNIGQYVLKH